MLLQNELYWKQRAKQHWLGEGDANTKFFHASASNRNRKNFITRLRNNEGVWVDWDSGLQSVIVEFYKQLFTSTPGDMGPILSHVQQKVTDQQNQMLIAPFSAEEVRVALFSMHPDKSPGPDGLNPGFFQKYWDIVGSDVTTACLNCLNGDGLMPGCNRTNIILIPKKSVPERVADLRPISLSNVVDRIVCKAMANRLKLVLPQVISEAQSAFIPHRLITDNIIVAYELFHSLKQKKQGKRGCWH